MPSATTQESRDSIAARIAMVNAFGIAACTISKFTAGRWKDGSALLIVYRFPMVETFKRQEFYHKNTNDNRDQGTWDLLKDIRRNNQDRQTYSSYDQCRRINSSNIFQKCCQLFHGLDRTDTFRIGHTKKVL